MLKSNQPTKNDSLLLIEKMGELVKVNNLILHLLPLDSFIKEVEDKLEDIVYNNPLEYVNDYGVTISEDVIDEAIEFVWKLDNKDFEIPTAVYEAVHGKINKVRLHSIEVEAEVKIQEGLEYQQNPLRTLGMRQSDFL